MADERPTTHASASVPVAAAASAAAAAPPQDGPPPRQNDCIVVLSDDSGDDDERDEPEADEPEAIAVGLRGRQQQQQQQPVDALVEILPLVDRARAEAVLERFDFDVMRAVAHLLEEAERVSKAQTTGTKRSLFPTEPTNGSICSRPGHAAADAAADSTGNSHLSEQWHEAYNSTPAGGFFKDPDFPPQACSIDGRLRPEGPTPMEASPSATTTTSPSSTDARIVRCHCGVPARPRTVRSDGPNYGRFYLACGRRGRQKRRAPVVAERKSPSKRPANGSEQNTRDDSTTTAAAIHNPYAKLTTDEPQTDSKPPSTPPQRQECDFFQWDDGGRAGAAALSDDDAYATGRLRSVSWRHFGLDTGHILYKRRHGKTSGSVQQGSLGNCWFLSALAVVAEQPYLIDRILRHDALDDRGVYQVDLCLDGQWTPVIVDSYLPVVEKGLHRKRRLDKRGSPEAKPLKSQVQMTLSGVADLTNYSTAFCATPDKQLWPALIEKAYAKAHGSYANLSGGFIAEGLTDLTGAPTETIVLERSALLDPDGLWARLLSFAEAGFVMGVATSFGGQGLVGGHAYSILNVIEIPDMIVGEQIKLRHFDAGKKEQHSNATNDDDVVEVRRPINMQQKQTIRLVHIRNPWGKREWKGSWSADSERWTKALRSRLGATAYSKGEGTFYMEFSDMVLNFEHLDVAKTRRGWGFTSSDGCFRQNTDPVVSSQYVYTLNANERTWMFLSLVQPKKRANTSRRYYYSDISLVLLKRRRSATEWICETVILAGVKRSITAELFLDPIDYEYVCVPYSCIESNKGKCLFRLTAYSAVAVHMERHPIANLSREAVVRALHQEVVSHDNRLLFSIAERSVLCCIRGDGCLYFVAINGCSESYLSMKLTMELVDGIQIVYGKESESYDVAPNCQKILLVVSTDGKFSSMAAVKFRYLSSQVKAQKPTNADAPPDRRISATGFGSAIPITWVGKQLVSHIDPQKIQNKGHLAIDTLAWSNPFGAALRSR